MSIVAPIVKPIVSGIVRGLTGDSSASGATLAFLAMAANDDGEWEGVITGTGDITEGRTSSVYMPDFEDVYREFKSGEAAVKGGRVVRNLATQSGDLTNADWTASSSTVSDGVTDPDGGSTAFTLAATAATGSVYQKVENSPNAGDKVVGSCWVRRRTGTGNIELQAGDYGNRITITVTTSWQRFATPAITLDGSSSYILVRLITSGDEVDVWHPQYEKVDGQTNQNPSEYVPTTTASAVKSFNFANGNTVSSNVVTEAKGDLIVTAGQPERVTNGDFATDSDWTKGTGWTIAAGVSSCDGTQTITSDLGQTSVFESGKLYKTTFTVSNYSAGQVKMQVHGVSGTQRSANGTYTEYITANGANFAVRADVDFIGSIDNVSVKEVTDQPWTYSGPALTNSCLYSNDLTGASWSSTAIVTQNQTGIDGSANGATLVEDDNASGDERPTQSGIAVASTSAGDDVTMRFWVKKDADETRFPSFRISQDSTATRWQLNTKTGATTVVETGGSAVASAEVVDGGDWWILHITMEAVSVNSFSTFIYPAESSSWGSLTPNATGSIVVGQVEFHAQKTIAAVRGATPVFTEASSVSVVASAISFAIANHAQTGCYYTEYMPMGVAGDGVIRLGSSDIPIQQQSLAAFRSLSNGDAYCNVAQAVTSGSIYKCGLAFSTTDSLKELNVEGSVHEVAYNGFDGTIPAINVAGGKFGASPTYVGYIRNVRRYDITAYQDGKDKLTELMA